MSLKTPSARRRLTWSALGAGLAGAAFVTLSLGGSLSGFVATITNSNNTIATASMAVSETSGAATCNSYDSTTNCTTINKYGGTAVPVVPGGSQTVTVNFANTGTVNATTSVLAPAACKSVVSTPAPVGAQTPSATNTDPSNLCSQLNVAVYKGATATGTPLYTGTAAAFTAQVNLGALAAGANQSYTFVTSLPAGATTAVQGQTVSQNLVWTFNQ